MKAIVENGVDELTEQNERYFNLFGLVVINFFLRWFFIDQLIDCCLKKLLIFLEKKNYELFYEEVVYHQKVAQVVVFDDSSILQVKLYLR